MRRPVVHNPEQAFPGLIGFLGQHLVDQTPKRLDASRGLTPSHDIPPAYIPGGQVLQRPAPLVFVLDAQGVPWGRRQAGMTAAPRLDTGFFVGTENVILGSQPLALPEPCIQVEDRSGLLGKLGIPGKEPIAVVPGFNRILA